MNDEFFDAIKRGDLERVQKLMAADPGLLYEKQDGLSPVMAALSHKQQDVAELIAEKTINIRLFESVALGKLSRVSMLIARDPLAMNSYSEDGYSLLGFAARFGRAEVVEFLIQSGAAINAPSQCEPGYAPLHFAVAENYEKVAALLLDYEADPNVRDQNGCTPLHIAARNGNSQLIRILLFNGANLTMRAKNAKLPIDLALDAGHKQAAGLLKEGITRRFRVRQPKGTH